MTDTVKLTYDVDKTAFAPMGIKLEQLLELLPPRDLKPVAAVVNGDIKELDYPLYVDSRIVWQDYTMANGHRVYKRSLIFILLVAAHKLYPDRELKVYHSLENGTYCQLLGEAPLAEEDISKLEEEMRKIVESDLPITPNELSKNDAIAYFKSQGKEEKAALMAMRQGDGRLLLYTLEGIGEYFFGRMANRTGLIDKFQLIPFDAGFIVRMPAQKEIGFTDQPFSQPRRLYATIQEYWNHARFLEITTVSELNEVIKNGEIAKLSLVEETIQERAIHKIADSIADDFPQVRLVMIAGPSSSGKTTFTQRLSLHFRALGIHPLTISIDDYFINRADTPLDEHGAKDFESIEAIDLNLFNIHLERLINGKSVHIPRYDFITGTRMEEYVHTQLGDNHIILIEGIHGLNEELTKSVSSKNKRKIYISALTQLKLDSYNPIPTSDNRILRRILRDMQFRNHSPEQTIMMWDSIRRGEAKNIFPYQENADYFFNSAFLNELAIIGPRVEKAMAEIGRDSPAYLEVRRLLRFIQYFLPIDADFIPNNSILREFLGGSIFNTD